MSFSWSRRLFGATAADCLSDLPHRLWGMQHGGWTVTNGRSIDGFAGQVVRAGQGIATLIQTKSLSRVAGRAPSSFAVIAAATHRGLRLIG